MQGPIVVPLDGSSLAEHALSLGIALARRARQPLHLVRVHLGLAEGEYPSLEDVHEALRAEEREYLARIAQRVEGKLDVPVHMALLEAPVAASIEAYARSHRTGVIVMTTHGRSGLSRLWMGSVVDALVRLEGIPVLAIRPDEGSPDLSRVHAFRHILVPLDGSIHAESVLPHATAVAGLRDVRYTLVQVVRATLAPMANPGQWPPTSVMPAGALVGQLAARAEAYLRGVADRLRAAGVQDVRTMVAVDDHPAAALLRCIATYKADLVAMSTHGRGMSRLVVGSVADKVLRAAGRPVLLIRPPTEAKSRTRSARGRASAEDRTPALLAPDPSAVVRPLSRAARGR